MGEVRKTQRSSGTGVVYDFSAARQRAQAAPPAPTVDSAGITEDARELARAFQNVMDSPEVRAERVRELKGQIERGEYRSDPREVARKILQRGL